MAAAISRATLGFSVMTSAFDTRPPNPPGEAVGPLRARDSYPNVARRAGPPLARDFGGDKLEALRGLNPLTHLTPIERLGLPGDRLPLLDFTVGGEREKPEARRAWGPFSADTWGPELRPGEGSATLPRRD